jgi:hypothetical protein
VRLTDQTHILQLSKLAVGCIFAFTKVFSLSRKVNGEEPPTLEVPWNEARNNLFSPRAVAATQASSLLRPAQKMIVITFGGGARDEETFAEDGRENIPNLLHTLLPQDTFFSQVVNAGILGHYVATTKITIAGMLLPFMSISSFSH